MSKKRILVVDDNVRISRALKLTLEQAGPYEVMVENDPRRAKSVALNFRPDLIILDVIMPEMDGGTVASDIREHDSMKDMPVLFLTSILDKDEAAAKDGKIGHDPVMAKPVTADELVARIEKMLQSH